jgi:hypothetical protein
MIQGLKHAIKMLKQVEEGLIDRASTPEFSDAITALEHELEFQKGNDLDQVLLDLFVMTPERPNAVTWETGCKIITTVQDRLCPLLRKP